MGLLAMRLLQFSWFTIERCSIVEAGMARGCSPWGVASITHIVCGVHARRRVSLSSVPDCLWHRSLRPRPKTLTAKSSPGYLGAGHAFGKGLYERGWRVRAVGALGRYDYRGTLFGAGADLGKTLRRRSELRRSTYGLPVPHPSLVSKIVRRRRSRRSEHHAARSGEFGARQCGRPQARKAGSTFRRCGSSPSMARTDPRFSNIGAWRGRAIAFRHASRLGLKAARSATRNTTRAVAAAS